MIAAMAILLLPILAVPLIFGGLRAKRLKAKVYPELIKVDFSTLAFSLLSSLTALQSDMIWIALSRDIPRPAILRHLESWAEMHCCQGDNEHLSIFPIPTPEPRPSYGQNFDQEYTCFGVDEGLRARAISCQSILKFPHHHNDKSAKVYHHSSGK